jgi:hypothetical protein
MAKAAWKTTACGLVSAVAASSRSEAMAITMRSANDAGYRIKFIDVKCVRWPEHDSWANVASFNGPLDPMLLPKQIEVQP